MIDATHDPARTSWVASSNGHSEFPIQNLPFGVFSTQGGRPRGGIAIGNAVFDIAAALEAGLFSGTSREAAEAAAGHTLNPLLALSAGARRALRQRVSDVLPDIEAETTFSKPVRGPVDLGDVYAAAKIGAPPHGYTVLKVAEMLQSEHIRALPAEVKRKSIMVALDAAGVKIADIVEDAVRRDRALDTYERVLRKSVDDVRAQTAAENKRLETEIAQRVSELRAQIDENNKKAQGEQDEFLAWQSRKHQEEEIISEGVSYCIENPDYDEPQREGSRRRRCSLGWSRLFRAWMGFFISLGRSEIMLLQDAIEEMRMTMPKLNSVLVATRATVIGWRSATRWSRQDAP